MTQEKKKSSKIELLRGKMLNSTTKKTISILFSQRDETTSNPQASSLTNMFDPTIYACQSFISGSTSNPSIQSSITSETVKAQTPTSSPQKNKHVNSNTVIPIQSPGNMTPQRKPSQQETEETMTAIIDDAQYYVNNESASNSGENSRKTSTISDGTLSDHTPENTIVTPKQNDNEMADPHKQSPVRKLSRFLVSPTIIETANKELIVQEEPPQQPEVITTELEMNINEESYQRMEVQPTSESELQPQQSISGFKMPETLEQLKIELENITHAHVQTKPKEVISNQPTSLPPEAGDEITEPISSDAQVESSVAEYPSMTDQTLGSITTGDNTSVYNSRRTSTDLNPTDLTSAASDRVDDENLVSDVADDGSKLQLSIQSQAVDRYNFLMNECVNER
jgi:hypothetical protein